MFVNTIDPVLFSIGPLAIRWYGLVYALGFVAVYIALTRTNTLKPKDADSFLLWLIVGMLIGARTFHFLFYQGIPQSILEFFAVWQGGMSFHGALLGLGIAGWWWAKRNNKNFWELADISSIVAAFFLALGRIANFTNSEIIGQVSTTPWCVEFPNAPNVADATGIPLNEECRHPTQIYAMIKNLFLGTVLLLLWKKKRYAHGFVFWSFVTLYGILRFTVQFWRTDAVVAFGLQWGHYLSLVLVIVGAAVLWNKHLADLRKLIKRS